ncbi:unnamed protein product, partial [Heterotrigona itama]
HPGIQILTNTSITRLIILISYSLGRTFNELPLLVESLLKLSSDKNMNVLRPAFNILIVCGCWMPSFCRTSCAKLFYNLYTTFVILLLHSFCISQFLNVILNVSTADELSDSLYMFIASVLSCCKILALLINRKAIGALGKQLEQEPCKPVDTQEIIVQRKFDRSIGSITIFYTIMVMLTVACMILFSFLTDFSKLKLAYRAWLPFNYTVPNYYYMAYAHQIVALIGTALLNVACDVLVCGLFVHVCSQQEILKHRIKGLTKQSRPDIRKIVRFHDYLYRYTSIIQTRFKEIIGIQLLSSTLVVCFILYRLSNTPINSKYVEFILYLVCMMMQIFFYCWYGNQLKLKSVEVVDTIFEMDWVSLDNHTQKCLINVMRRGISPIELTCVYVFKMDLRTFVNVMCACWRPPLLSPLKNFAYTIYRCYIILLVYGGTFLQFVDLIFIVETQDEFCDNVYLTLAFFISCLKMYSVLSSRGNIVAMMNMLETAPFQPETKEEIEIREKCDKQTRSNAFYYALLVESSVAAISVSTLPIGGLHKDESGKLIFRMWVPINCTSIARYSFIYVQQILSLTFSALLHVACDSLIWALLMFTCNQIEIFGHRLRHIKRDQNETTRLCIRYHNLIYRYGIPFARMISKEFELVIFVQFATSTLTICINLYILTGTNLSFERLLQLTMYSSCMLTQIYIFCWYGNEVKLKIRCLLFVQSLDISNMIFELDWLPLKQTTKHDLLMVMMRATSPIEMTSAYVVTMNLESFVIV